MMYVLGYILILISHLSPSLHDFVICGYILVLYAEFFHVLIQNGVPSFLLETLKEFTESYFKFIENIADSQPIYNLTV